jgi:hypothetical protein
VSTRPTSPAAQRPLPARPAGVHRMIALTMRLAELIEGEIQVLQQRRPGELQRSAAEKEDLSHSYQEELNALRAHPDVVRAADKADVEALRACGQRLNKALDDQRRRVVAAREVSERMLRAVTEEVEKRKTPFNVYTAAANIAKPNRKKQMTAPTALAFHEVV